jgi:hypothetical protein
MEYKCETCGKVFLGYPSKIRKHCSHECYSLGNRGVTRGSRKTPLYSVWTNMRARCSKPNYRYYHNYGGRGIRVCKEWDCSFEAFQSWAFSNGYCSNLQIDRINNNGNYEPNNCRWVTREQNMANTRKFKKGSSKYKGVQRHPVDNQWRTTIRQDGKTKHLGLYRTQLAAALAYDDAAYSLRGKFALLNFPERKRALIGA